MFRVLAGEVGAHLGMHGTRKAAAVRRISAPDVGSLRRPSDLGPKAEAGGIELAKLALSPRPALPTGSAENDSGGRAPPSAAPVSTRRAASPQVQSLEEAGVSYLRLQATLQQISVLVLVIVQPTLLKAAMSMLDCTEHAIPDESGANARPRLIADPELVCLRGLHSVVAVLVIFIAALGFPLFGSVLLWVMRDKLHYLSMLRRFGFLYSAQPHPGATPPPS